MEAEVLESPQLNDLINLAGANRLHPHGFLASWWITFWEMYCARVLAQTNSQLSYDNFVNAQIIGSQIPMNVQQMPLPQQMPQQMSVPQQMPQQMTQQMPQQMAMHAPMNTPMNMPMMNPQHVLGQPMSPASLMQHLNLSPGGEELRPGIPTPAYTPINALSPKRPRSESTSAAVNPASEYTQWFMQQPPVVRQQILALHQQQMQAQQKSSVMPKKSGTPGGQLVFIPTHPVQPASADAHLPKVVKPPVVGSASAPASQVGSPTSLARRRSSLANQIDAAAVAAVVAAATAPAVTNNDMPDLNHPAAAKEVDPDSFFNLDASQNGGDLSFPFLSYRDLEGHQGKAVSCAWSHDAQLLATAGHDQVVRVWTRQGDSEQLVLLGSLESVHSAPIAQVRFTPSGRRLLATASFDKTVRLFDFGPESMVISSLEQVVHLPAFTEHTGPVLSIDFMPQDDCDRVASCDGDGWLLQWSISTRSVIHRTNLQEAGAPDVTVRQIKYQPHYPSDHDDDDERQAQPPLLAVANGTSVLFYSPDGEQVSQLETGWSKQIVSLTWSVDRHWPQLMVLASADTVGVWLNPRQPVATFSLPSDRINICTLMRTDQPTCIKVLFGTYRMIYAWRVQPDKPDNGISTSPVSIEAHAGMVAGLSVTRCGALLLASVAHDGGVRVWSTVARTEPPSAVEFDLDFLNLTASDAKRLGLNGDFFN